MQEGPILKFETWAPDLSAIDTNVTVLLSNVLPRADGYGPAPSWQQLTQALGSPCRGAIFARDPVDGSIIVFAATSQDLWKLNNTTFQWQCISKQGYGAIATGTIVGGTGFTASTTFNNMPLIGGTHGGGGAIATIVVNSSGVVTTVTLTTAGSGYAVGDVLTVPIGALGIGGTGFTFTVATLSGGAPPTPSTTPLNEYAPLIQSDNWQFLQFTNTVIAVQQNSPPQKFVLRQSTYFTDLSGTPPQASHITVINQFVILTGVLNAPFRVQWSDFSAPENWIPGLGLSNYQDLPDGGVVHDIRGSDQYGVIFQDASIRMMSLSFGSQFVFQILRIATLDGIFGQYSSVTAGDRVFFCSPQGFKKIEQGGAITPIGKERVDRTFFADVDQSVQAQPLFIATTDPRSTRVYWMYKSVSGAAGLADKVLIYDWALDRWTILIGQSLEYLFYLTKPGVTADGLDALAIPQISVTAAADNGAHTTIRGLPVQVRLTLSSLSVGTPPGNFNLGTVGNQLQNTIELWGATGGLANLVTGGSAGFQGNFGFTIIDSTHIDLIGPTFAQVGATGTATIGGSLDQLTTPLDSLSSAPAAQLAAFAQAGSAGNTIDALGLFTGPNLEAILETPDQDLGNLVFIEWMRPLSDAPVCFGMLGGRRTPSQVVGYTTEAAINPVGLIPTRIETRYARGHLRVPAGQSWNYASGMKSPDAVPEQGVR